MRHYDYRILPSELLRPEIINLVAAIHEHKGKQDLYLKAKPDALEKMTEVAKIQSTGASNRIEGIFTSEERLSVLMKTKAEPRNRSEREILGYREVLNLIHENYEYMGPRPNIILQMHRDLYQYDVSAAGGSFKVADNLIKEIGVDGTERVRFQPVSAFETAESIERLTSHYLAALEERQIDSLLLIAMFIFDFVSIHPFRDGNGRMSRLLTLLLLYREGYLVGKYISLEMIIEKTKEAYYGTLEESSAGWLEEKSNYYPFVKYYLEIILRSYREFSERVELVSEPVLTKIERIRKLFDQTAGKLSKKDIQDHFPDISEITIERALALLRKEEFIVKVGGGRGTSYVRNHEQS